MAHGLFSMLLGSAVALQPLFAKNILQLGPQGLGLLPMAAPCVTCAADMLSVMGR